MPKPKGKRKKLKFKIRACVGGGYWLKGRRENTFHETYAKARYRKKILEEL